MKNETGIAFVHGRYVPSADVQVIASENLGFMADFVPTDAFCQPVGPTCQIGRGRLVQVRIRIRAESLPPSGEYGAWQRRQSTPTARLDGQIPVLLGIEVHRVWA